MIKPKLTIKLFHGPHGWYADGVDDEGDRYQSRMMQDSCLEHGHEPVAECNGCGWPSEELTADIGHHYGEKKWGYDSDPGPYASGEEHEEQSHKPAALEAKIAATPACDLCQDTGRVWGMLGSILVPCECAKISETEAQAGGSRSAPKLDILFCDGDEIILECNPDIERFRPGDRVLMGGFPPALTVTGVNEDRCSLTVECRDPSRLRGVGHLLRVEDMQIRYPELRQSPPIPQPGCGCRIGDLGLTTKCARHTSKPMAALARDLGAMSQIEDGLRVDTPTITRLSEDRVRVDWRGESVEVRKYGQEDSVARGPGDDGEDWYVGWLDEGVYAHAHDGARDFCNIPVPAWNGGKP